MEFRFGMAGELSAEMTAGTNSAIMLILLVLILVPYLCICGSFSGFLLNCYLFKCL